MAIGLVIKHLTVARAVWCVRSRADVLQLGSHHTLLHVLVVVGMANPMEAIEFFFLASPLFVICPDIVSAAEAQILVTLRAVLAIPA